MYRLDGAKRTVFGRRLANLSLALLVAVAVAMPLLPARPAYASTPPGPCETWEDGNRISIGAVTYECRCKHVSGHTDWVCEWVNVTKDALKANANYNFVSTELGYTGGYYAMLRARAGSVGSLEQYSLGSSGFSDGTWSLRSLANGLYVSSEFGYTGANYGMLRARAYVIDSTEKFYLYQVGSQYALQSYLPPNSTCCYVSTEIGYGGGSYGMLRARAYSVGVWEKYWLVGLGGFSPTGSASQATPTAGGPLVPSATTGPCPKYLTAALKEPCKKLIPLTNEG